MVFTENLILDRKLLDVTCGIRSNQIFAVNGKNYTLDITQIKIFINIAVVLVQFLGSDIELLVS